MSFHIPRRLRPAFMAHMDANNHDEAPDGAWFAMLETAGAEFMLKHRIYWGDCNDAVHYYIKLKNAEQEDG
tara:strand:+ start:35814 stop:36026 length:213 start_codon:yes stop_codon:yes gene_type:complete